MIGEIPIGGFKAPLYKLGAKENHNNIGYHFHILKRNSGSYKRTNYLLTLDSLGKIYAMDHAEGKNELLDFLNKQRAIFGEIGEEFKEKSKKIKVEDFLKPKKDKSTLIKI